MAIHQRLLEFSKKGITVERDATNPHFRSLYTSLKEVLAKVKPALNEIGVLIVQKPEVESGLTCDPVPGLRTRLIDIEDGSEETCFLPFVGTTDMQKTGGAITYARRYSLVTMLNLEDEDDDGNTAAGYMKKDAGSRTEQSFHNDINL